MCVCVVITVHFTWHSKILYMTSIKLIYFFRNKQVFLWKYLSQLRFRDASCVDFGIGDAEWLCTYEKKKRRVQKESQKSTSCKFWQEFWQGTWKWTCKLIKLCNTDLSVNCVECFTTSCSSVECYCMRYIKPPDTLTHTHFLSLTHTYRHSPKRKQHSFHSYENTSERMSVINQSNGVIDSWTLFYSQTFYQQKF